MLNLLFLFSSFCSLLIWLGRAFLDIDFIFLGLEVIFRLGPPLASTTYMECKRRVCIIQVFYHNQALSPPHRACNSNLHGSSSSWFPQVTSSIASPGAHRHYRFLQIAFHSVCETICEEITREECFKSIRYVYPTHEGIFLRTSRVLTQSSSWSLSRSADCPWNESLTTLHGRCSSRPNSCTFLAYESQTSAYKEYWNINI